MSLTGLLIGVINIAIYVAVLLLIGVIIKWIVEWLGLAIPDMAVKLYIAIVALVALAMAVGLLAGVPLVRPII